MMTICLNLPLPPTVNGIYRYGKGRLYKAEGYKQWQTDAGWAIKEQRHRQMPVNGHFTSHIILSQERRGVSDIDNRLKALFDLLETHDLIKNDRLQDKLTVEWGEAPEGCKVYIWPTDGEPMQ
jgi:Holliday junction resolvase RusA-like endonuclease